MNGIHNIRVRTNKVEYNLDIKRNVTVIKGNSGTGKSTLVEMINLEKTIGKASGVFIKCDVPITIIDRRSDWKSTLSNNKPEILLVDEGQDIVNDKKFVDLFYKSGKYIIIISRQKLTYFEYSIDSIVELKEEKKYDTDVIINKFNKRFKNKVNNYIPEVIITEDTGSGKILVNKATGITTVGAGGKTKILNNIKSEVEKGIINIYVIVDGAAFGNEIEEIIGLIKYEDTKDIRLYAPESIEYMILNTEIFRNKAGSWLKERLEHTYDFIDYTRYKTWETYFTDILKDIVRKYFKGVYSKSKITAKVLKTERFLKEFKRELKDIKC